MYKGTYNLYAKIMGEGDSLDDSDGGDGYFPGFY